MCFHKLGRGRTARECALAAARLGLVALAVACASCAPDYVTGNSAPVNLYIAAVATGSGGTVLDSDVRNGVDSSFICPDFAVVSVAVRNKNPGFPAPNVPSAVIVNSYEVRYFRTDGRAVEGLDVPFRITGNLTMAVDVANSGTSDIPIEIVRRQAKMEPPLSTIFQTAVLTTIAEVTLYGDTIAGQRVSASGRIQVDFADFADKLTACPTK